MSHAPASLRRRRQSARGMAVVGLCGLLIGAGFSAARGIHQTPRQLRLTDIEGRPIESLRADHTRATVFLFTRSDCPVSNRYAPEIQRLSEGYRREGLAFFLVYLGHDESAEAIRAHVKEYTYAGEVLRDPHHDLVRLAGATITPEAAVFVRGELVYRGRIDDRYIDLGRARAEATTHDLRNALNAVLAAKPVPVARTDAVGCYIADLQ